eukprot:3343702-Amphidinium_carterae.1
MENIRLLCCGLGHNASGIYYMPSSKHTCFIVNNGAIASRSLSVSLLTKFTPFGVSQTQFSTLTRANDSRASPFRTRKL